MQHKVIRNNAKYLKWGALTGRICHNRGDLCSYRDGKNESKWVYLHIRRRELAGLAFVN